MTDLELYTSTDNNKVSVTVTYKNVIREGGGGTIDAYTKAQSDAKYQAQQVGKGLSTNDYTDQDKTKLTSLNNYFVGNYPSLSALNTAHPTGVPGQTATVDVQGSDAKQYIWDSTDNAWVLSGSSAGTGITSVNGDSGPTVVLTKSSIGLANVPNIDATNPVNIVQDSTHKFTTDADKTRLANTSGTNTGDQDISGIAANETAISNEISARQSADTNLQSQISALVTVPAIKKKFGILIPVFKVGNKFDNLGAALSTPQLAIAAGGGLISGTAGTLSEGYLKLQTEIIPTNPTRTDWKILWDTTDTNYIKVGLPGYLINIANTGGNLVITWPSGATVSGAMTGILNLSVSISTGNGVVTCSVSVLGVPALATNNKFRVPVWESVVNINNGLFSVYFGSTSIASKIIGFLHNSNDWSGDPFGQLLTQSVVVNGAGWPGEHDNLIVIPPRANIANTMRVVNFCHGRTLQASSIFDIAIGDNGETGRQLLNAGYAVIGTSGGVWFSGSQATNECDYWGNPTGTQRAAQVYDAIAANVYNVGNEYLIGWSMGGCSTTNYARLFCNRVVAVDLSCPVLDMEENTATPGNGVQNSPALKQGIDWSYASWYIGKTGVAVNPYSDSGTNVRQIAGPGQYPDRGSRGQAVLTITAAGTAVTNITLTAANADIKSGDIVYFKLSGQQRYVIGRPDGSTTFLTLNAPVTYPANEQVTIVRNDGRPNNSFNWNSKPIAVNTGATAIGVGSYARGLSPHPELDIRPHNPIRFTDFFAEVGIPFRITTSGARNTNDGILNNEPMYAFADSVNSITPGLVTTVLGSGGHLAAGTLNAAGTLAFFNAH